MSAWLDGLGRLGERVREGVGYSGMGRMQKSGRTDGRTGRAETLMDVGGKHTTQQ